MPRVPLAPITHPTDLTRARRVALALWLLAAFALLTAWSMYHLGVSSTARIYPVLPIVLVGMLLDALLLRSFRLPKRGAPHFPRPLGIAIMLATLLCGMAVFISLIAHPIAPRAAYSALLGGPILITGITLAGSGLFGQRPGEPVCSACDYPTTGLTLPTRCPECAEPLREDAIVYAPTPDPNLRLAATGIGLIALAVSFILLMRFSPATFYRALPDTIHARLAAAEIPAFDALDRTNLTSAQRNQLAERIIDARHRREQVFLTPQIEWLSRQITDRSLRPDLVHRFATEGFNPEIITRPLSDGRTQISIAAEPPHLDYSQLMQFYFIAGFQINNAPPIGRDDKPRDADHLDHDWARRDLIINHYATPGHPRNADAASVYPMITLPPTDTPVRIRARIITVLTRGPPRTPAITWLDDGSYTITGDPIYTAELTAQSTIEIAR